MIGSAHLRISVAEGLSIGLFALVLVGAGRPDPVEEGQALFARAWTPRDPRSRMGDGLGPVFNAQSCLQCHDQGGPGGAGGGERNIDVATATGLSAGANGYGFAYSFGMDFGAGRFEYRLASNPPATPRRPPAPDPLLTASIHPGFQNGTSVLLHRFGIDPAYRSWRETIPGPHGTIEVRVTQRNPTPLFGAGLIDAIPDEVIEAAARRKAVGASKVKGRVARTKDGRVGRFGWKSQTATLAEFVRAAAAGELGLEVPGHHQAADPRLPGLGAPGLDLDERDCEALTAYVRSLPAPVVREPADDKETAHLQSGEATFRAVGCADCHTPSLGDVEGLYSDLLLHDMDSRLGDTGVYGVFAGPGVIDVPARAANGGATPQEWRTPPLWGLSDSAPYLHDGRAATIAQAIALHGGQGASSARRFASLTARRKQQVEDFLLSLTAPRADERPRRVAAP